MSYALTFAAGFLVGALALGGVLAYLATAYQRLPGYRSHAAEPEQKNAPTP